MITVLYTCARFESGDNDFEYIYKPINRLMCIVTIVES